MKVPTKLLAGIFVLLFLLGGTLALARERPSLRDHGPVAEIWAAIDFLQKQIDELRNDLENIQLLPGPPGPQGEQGPPGEPGWDEDRILESVVFFNQAEGLVNGSGSSVVETSGFKNLWIYFSKPEDCQSANTAVFMTSSPDSITWFNVGPNLCPAYNGTPLKLEVSGKYFKARVSFMNVLDDNPKPPVTVKGFLTQ